MEMIFSTLPIVYVFRRAVKLGVDIRAGDAALEDGSEVERAGDEAFLGNLLRNDLFALQPSGDDVALCVPAPWTSMLGGVDNVDEATPDNVRVVELNDASSWSCAW